MDGKTKKFFVLKNFKLLKSKRQNTAGEFVPSSDIVAEAERIIDTYLYRIGYDKRGGKRKKTGVLGFLLSGFLLAAAAFCIIRFVV